MSHGTLSLSGAGNSSGTFTAASGAVLELASNFTFTNGALFSGAGSTQLDNGTITRFSGTLTNDGTIRFASSGSTTELLLSGDVTLNGTGTISLDNTGADVIFANNSGDTLTIGANQTIQGSGDLGNQQTDIVNNGTISATQSSPLEIDGGTLTNNGVLREDSGSLLELVDGVQVSGTINTAGTEIHILSATFTNVTNNGLLALDNGSANVLVGTLTNNGTIRFAGSGSTTELLLSGDVILTGTGTISLDNTGADVIFAQSSGDTLTIGANQTIQGSGDLGNQQTNIVNNGTIIANNQSAPLQIDGGTLDGTGILQAANNGILELTDNVNVIGTINTAGTEIHVVRATFTNATNNGLLALDNGSGNTLVGTLTNDGTIRFAGSGSTTELLLSGDVTLTGTGTINLDNTGADVIFANNSGDTLTIGANQTIQGSGDLGNQRTNIVNNGIISATNPSAPLQIDGGTFTSTGILRSLNNASLEFIDNVHVNGGVIQTNGTPVRVISATFTDVTNNGLLALENGSENTLVGTFTNNGAIRFGSSGSSTSLVLSGDVTINGTGTVNLDDTGEDVIAALTAGDTLTIGAGETLQGSGDLGANRTNFINKGIISANLLQPLQIDGGTVTNQGVLQAVQGGTLQLANNVTVNGGTLQTANGGVISILSASVATLTNFTNTGSLSIENGATMNVEGTIDNTGAIALASAGSSTSLVLIGDASLSGGGTVTLEGNSEIRGNALLTNNGNTIQGAGSLGAGQLQILNNAGGVIDANVSSGTLLVEPGANGFDNKGTMEADNQGILELGVGGGNFTSEGEIFAGGGGLVQLDTNVTLTLNSNGLISAGGGGRVELDGTVTDNGGHGALSIGGGTMTIGGDVNVEQVIGGNGELDINSGGSLTARNGLNFEDIGGGGSLILTGPALTFGSGTGEINGADFNGGGAANANSPGGNGGSLNAVATSGDLTVGADIEASTGTNGSNVTTGGTGGTVNLTANSGTVTVNNRIQVSHNTTGRKSAAGGNITLKSGKTSGVAFNINSSSQLLALLDAAAPGPGGKIVIQATASSGSSQMNVSGSLQADRGTVDARHFSDSGVINLTNANVHADTVKIAALGNNGVLNIGGGTLSADTTLQLYAPNGNGQVVFIADVTLAGTSTKSIAGDSVTINRRR